MEGLKSHVFLYCISHYGVEPYPRVFYKHPVDATLQTPMLRYTSGRKKEGGWEGVRVHLSEFIDRKYIHSYRAKN